MYSSLRKKIFILIFAAAALYTIYFNVRYFQLKNQLLANCPPPKQAGNQHLYGQFFEDYILSIGLKEIENGSYIDVGAHHHEHFSVTKHFYEQGWRGINIEPIDKYYKMLKKERPEDINLQIGASNEESLLKFYQAPDHLSGLSTFDKDDADKTLVEKGIDVQSYEVKTTSLNKILQQYPMDKITFLKIDVEGYEKFVIEGIDLDQYRPAVIIVEATYPYSSKPSHEPWEAMITSKNYKLLLFDGLNRYYLAKEHIELLENFRYADYCASLANDTYVGRISYKSFIEVPWL